jgi:hypothetical protein
MRVRRPCLCGFVVRSLALASSSRRFWLLAGARDASFGAVGAVWGPNGSPEGALGHFAPHSLAVVTQRCVYAGSSSVSMRVRRPLAGAGDAVSLRSLRSDSGGQIAVAAVRFRWSDSGGQIPVVRFRWSDSGGQIPAVRFRPSGTWLRSTGHRGRPGHTLSCRHRDQRRGARRCENV